MRRPLLVTVSGMVGSGKSTALRQITDVAREAGLAAAQWRFQRLPCITFRRPRRETAESEDAAEPSQIVRGKGYRPRRLTITAAAGYMLRIAAFRLYRLFHRNADWYVVDRYFYDNFTHYDLSRGTGRFYAACLARLVPRPDLAFVLVASPQTVAARRPQVLAGYLVPVGQAYRDLRQRFPELIEVDSDPDRRGLDQIAALVRERLVRAR